MLKYRNQMSAPERKLYKELSNHLASKEFTIIAGARQTGKTTLMNQLFSKLLIDNELVYSVTFEDSTILDAINIHPEKLFDFIPKPKDKRVYVLIDEVQYADNPTNFLKLLYDKYAPQLKIIATGSSAFYIDKKFKDSLAGRKQLYELYTLDFEEFLNFSTGDNAIIQELIEIRSNVNYRSLRRSEIETLFDEYLVYGGYPAVALEKEPEKKIIKLRELVNTFVKRDILESNIADDIKFYNLMRVLAGQVGELLNTNELSNTLRLSTTAVDNYLYVLQKCFHVHLLRPYYTNLRKELTKMPKVFFNDTGLRNMILNYLAPVPARLDKGQLIENYTFIRLRQLYGNDALHYWRTADGNEVDFIVETSLNEGFAIESKYRAVDFKPTKYRKFTDNYAHLHLSCKAYETESNEGNILTF